MNSNEIFEVIEQIAATSSKNEKQAIVAAHIGDADFLAVLIGALDPLVTYGISKRPVTDAAKISGGGELFSARTWSTIECLAARDLTGNAAIDEVRAEMERLEPASSELFWRIIKKDLRAGFSAETVNKAKKGTIKDFPYMRCSLPKDAKLDEWDWTAGVPSQEKADGMYVNVDHEITGTVVITTRAGTLVPNEALGEIGLAIYAVLDRNTRSMGEMVVEIDGKVAPREIGNGILNSIIAGGAFEPNQRPVLMLWDQVPLPAAQPKGKYETHYITRLKNLIVQLKKANGLSSAVKLIPTKIVRTLAEAYAHCSSLQIDGKEGTVIKSPKGIWRDGTSKEQVKLKLEVDVDLVSVAILDGEEGTKNEGRAGRVTMESSDGLLRVNVAVKNEALRDAIDADRESFIGQVWAVRANQVMNPSDSNPLHSLFLPRMVEAGFRTDKTEADSLQRVKDQFEAAVHGEKAEALAA